MPVSPLESEELRTQLSDATFVYGAILVDEHLTFVEHVDDAEDDREHVLATALTSIGSTLVPFVHEHTEEFGTDFSPTVAPQFAEEFEAPRLTEMGRVSGALADARTVYLLYYTAEGNWKRISETVPERFGDDDELETPELGQYVVASALVEESRDRIMDISASITPETVDVIDWQRA